MSETLNTRQAAARVGLHYSWFRAVLAEGRGPVVAFRGGVGRGRACHFEAAELDRWAAERKTATPTAQTT